MYNTPVLGINLMEGRMKKFIFLLVSFFGFLNSSLHSITQEELQEYAINQNDSDLLDVVFKYPGSQKQPSLNLAMCAKDYFAVFMFIEYGVEINSRFDVVVEKLTDDLLKIGTGQTVLEMAIEFDEISLVEYFLFKKADPTNMRTFHESFQGYGRIKDDYSTSAVYDAIICNRLDMIILFAYYGADLNKICYKVTNPKSSKLILTQTPLQAAIAHKRRDMVAFFLSIGIEI